MAHDDLSDDLVTDFVPTPAPEIIATHYREFAGLQETAPGYDFAAGLLMAFREAGWALTVSPGARTIPAARTSLAWPAAGGGTLPIPVVWPDLPSQADARPIPTDLPALP